MVQKQRFLVIVIQDLPAEQMTELQRKTSDGRVIIHKAPESNATVSDERLK